MVKVDKSFLQCYTEKVLDTQKLLTESELLLDSKEPNNSINLDFWWKHQRFMLNESISHLVYYKYIEKSELRESIEKNLNDRLVLLDEKVYEKYQQLKSIEKN